MQQTITIDGTAIKRPSSFDIGSYNLTKAGRVASGKMMLDLIAKKTKLQLAYTTISSVDRSSILNLIDRTTLFFTVTYVEDNVVQTKQMYAGEIQGKQLRTGTVWYWQDFKFDLIEQ